MSDAPVAPPKSAKSVVFEGLFRGLGALPLWAIHGLSYLLVIPFIIFPSRHRRATWINIGLCFPELSTWQRIRWFLGSLTQSVRGIMEMGYFWYRPKDKVLDLIQSIEGLEDFEEALASDDPVLVGAPHFGAWELLCLYLSTRRQSSFIYREPRDAAFEALIRGRRSRFGANLVRANARGVRTLIRHGRRGDLIGMMPDHQPRRGDGVHVPFFGYTAYTMTLFSKLAQKENARVFIAYAQRLPRAQGFALKFVRATRAIVGQDLEASATALNQTIEEIIRNAPLQYEWTYKRFSMRPQGVDYDYDYPNPDLSRVSDPQTADDAK